MKNRILSIILCFFIIFSIINNINTKIFFADELNNVEENIKIAEDANIDNKGITNENISDKDINSIDENTVITQEDKTSIEENSTLIEGTSTFNKKAVIEDTTTEGISYESHVQNYGWQELKFNGETSGTTGQNLRVEGIKIQGVNLPVGSSILYRTHVQDYGWMDWSKDGELSGTTGESKRIEAVEIKLQGAPSDYCIQYRTHVEAYGWMEWKIDGQTSGTIGQAKRVEAIEVRIVKGNFKPKFSYQSFVTNEGWKSEVNGGITTGSSGSNKIQALKINLENHPFQIQYRAHVGGVGWESWKNSSEVAGIVEQNRRLEAVEIKLINASTNYHIMYRSNVKGYGWQGWKKDGQTSGTTGLSGEIIAIEMKIVQDIPQPNISYQTHVQSYGWQGLRSNGQTSGTVGEAKRLEGIKISLNNLPEYNSVLYRTHVQNYGWQNWVSNGELSGTTGESKRLEAIEIKLEKPIEGYELYYRVHVEGYGWQSWKKNGEVAGTTGEGKRLEAIEINLVKNKDKTIVIDAGHNYGGDDGAYSTHSGITYIERDINMQVAVKLRRELEVRGFNVIMTRNQEDREIVSMRDSLIKRVAIANNLAADFFISIHQNASIYNTATGIEAYYSSALPLMSGSFDNSSKVIKSSQLSSSIVNSIVRNMGRVNRGSKDEDFYVVKNTYMPSVLLECGFITNSTEAKNLVSGTLQQRMSELIAIEIYKNF